jgi:hypothetical protein
MLQNQAALQTVTPDLSSAILESAAPKPATTEEANEPAPLSNRDDIIVPPSVETSTEGLQLSTGRHAPLAAPPMPPLLRRSARERRVPIPFDERERQSYFASLEESLDPKTLEEALSSSHREDWIRAMDAEVQALELNKTWEALPASRVKGRPLKGKWVYKTKRDAQGAVLRYKARWVAKGYEQREGIDYDETFAAVVRAVTFRVLLTLAAHYDWEIEQMDVVTAFLNPTIDVELYMELPTGYAQNGKHCRLLKTLYGLKQSARQWFNTLVAALEKFGLTQLTADSCVFVGGYGDDLIIVAIYVDDILLFGPSPARLAKLKADLSQAFKMTDMGPCEYYLGVHIQRDRVKRTIKISQSSYIKRLLAAFDLDLPGKSNATPIEKSLDASPSNWNAPTELLERYQSVVGHMIYSMTQTRLDLAQAASSLSQFCANPSEFHWKAAKRSLRYLRGRVDLGITIGGPPAPSPSGQVYEAPLLDGYVDSDFAGDVSTRKSTTGYVFRVLGTPVSWCSQRQRIVTLSSTEAEYVAATEAAKEAIWLQRLLRELGAPDKSVLPVPLRMDNQGAMALAYNPEHHSRTKHIDVRHHWIREQVGEGYVTLIYVQSQDNLADGFTKPLPAASFEAFLGSLKLSR